VIKVELGEDAVKKVIDIVDRLSERFGRRPIWVIGVDRAVRAFSEREIDLLHAVKEHVRRLESLMILVLMAPDGRLLRIAAPIANIHLRATRRHGCILLYGVQGD